MKKLIFLTVSLLCHVCLMAQGVQTATLHHGSEFKAFYSAYAFKEAMAEAQPGDVINLSAGTFVSPEITVPVTVRGAGIGALDDAEDVSKARTTISNQIIINVPTNDDGLTLSMEGIVCDGGMSIAEVSNAIFSKMKIKNMDRGRDAKMNNVTLFHCIFEEMNFAEDATFLIYNCVFPGFRDSSVAAQISVYNSLINMKSSSYVGNNKNTTYNNCIINLSEISRVQDVNYTNANLYDCLCIGGDENTFGKRYNSDNDLAERNNRLFPNDTPAFVDGTYYRLTDDAAAYLGNDGTQVGIYGSALPFSVKTSYPQIKKFVVAPESTTDGKLKIELEIDAAN
ncbi:hypothetical protein [uncultured Duncaniella sp.]|uniref:hypothetical protein n=1 Tax=uncultured Duncaniella sp. TaxID=2768039 RepID=UPI002617B937|nr:hypothetical protein [uncultured Duncaniella sp.]